MLREILEIEQRENEGLRRWFNSKDMDLFIWCDDKHNISRFQLSLNDFSHEYLIDWSVENGLDMGIVDNDEELSVKHYGSPLIHSNKGFSAQKILFRYLRYANEINREINHFILSKTIFA